MMFTLLACVVALILGIQLGATWPALAPLGLRHFPSTTERPQRAQESVMPQSAQTRRRLFWLTVVMVFVIFLALVTGILLIITRITLARTSAGVADYQACQAQYQQAFASAYTARADANIHTQHAADRIFRVVAAGEWDELDDATQHYLKVRARQTHQQQTHPLPPLPTKVCGLAPKGDD